MRLKKQTKLFKWLPLVLAFLLPQVASAYYFMVDGLAYNINEDGTSVTVTFTEDWSDINYSGLTTANIPSTVTYNGTTYSVTSIDVKAFSGCSGLTSVTIPNSVTSIQAYAFNGCSGLTSVNIPNSVTLIGYGAFLGCTGLTSIVVESGNTKYDSRNNCNAIIETATNTLIFGCKNTIIPNSVTFIGGSAFYGCSGLILVTIPSSVTEIGDWSFRDCSGLTSVTIPNSVTSIGKSAFSGCSKIRTIYSKIVNPESVTYGSNIFQGVITIHCKLYVPAGTVDDYQFTAPWNDFLNIIEEGGGSTTPVHGDVNGDGVVTAADVTEIYNILLEN